MVDEAAGNDLEALTQNVDVTTCWLDGLGVFCFGHRTPNQARPLLPAGALYLKPSPFPWDGCELKTKGIQRRIL